MADRTNAEVSDEREIDDFKYLIACVTAHADKFPVPEHMRALAARCVVALNRRSVTSQASEGAELTEALTLGWWNSKDLKLTITETGEVMTNDREALRAIFDALPEVTHGGIKGFDVVPATPVSKRVERLETALTWYEEKVTACRKITSEGEGARHALDADGGNRARQALQGGRS